MTYRFHLQHVDPRSGAIDSSYRSHSAVFPHADGDTRAGYPLKATLRQRSIDQRLAFALPEHEDPLLGTHGFGIGG